MRVVARLPLVLPDAGPDYGAVGSTDQAVATYRKVISMSPFYAPHAYLWMGQLCTQKDWAAAIPALREALRVLPESRVATGCRRLPHRPGRIAAQGDYAGALDAYREAAGLAERRHAQQHMAWFLAAGPDGIRDGRRAVEYAVRACELTDRKNAPCTSTPSPPRTPNPGTSTGRSSTRRKPSRSRRSPKQYGAEVRERLDLYARKTPYRDPSLARREIAPPPRVVPVTPESHPTPVARRPVAPPPDQSPTPPGRSRAAGGACAPRPVPVRPGKLGRSTCYSGRRLTKKWEGKPEKTVGGSVPHGTGCRGGGRRRGDGHLPDRLASGQATPQAAFSFER